MRRTKIIATVGPSCNSEDMLRALADSGVNIFRLNFSHGDHETHAENIKNIRKLERLFPHPFGIMLDTKGPEIRTADVHSPFEIKKGETLILTTQQGQYESTGKLSVSYSAFIDDVEVGDKILVDNGNINLVVTEKKNPDIICQVLDGGKISSRRHINLPGRDPSLETITDKDWKDIEFGINAKVDFIAMSFVRTGEEIHRLREYLQKKKASHIKLIAKIESYKATQHLEEIAEAADGIMVARGDLGAEVPFEQVPRLQRQIITICKHHKKPTIVATHMLESMIQNPIPTRAEVSDISEAVWQRTDAIMLSGETAGGNHPLKAIDAMNRVALATEKDFLSTRNVRLLQAEDDKVLFAKLAAEMTDDNPDVKTMIVITQTGRVARYVSAFRPRLPILACTESIEVQRQMQLLWGTKGFVIRFDVVAPERTVVHAEKEILRHYPELQNTKYLLVSDFLENKKFVPTLQIRTLDGKG